MSHPRSSNPPTTPWKTLVAENARKLEALKKCHEDEVEMRQSLKKMKEDQTALLDAIKKLSEAEAKTAEMVDQFAFHQKALSDAKKKLAKLEATYATEVNKAAELVEFMKKLKKQLDEIEAEKAALTRSHDGIVIINSSTVAPNYKVEKTEQQELEAAKLRHATSVKRLEAAQAKYDEAMERKAALGIQKLPQRPKHLSNLERLREQRTQNEQVRKNNEALEKSIEEMKKQLKEIQEHVPNRVVVNYAGMVEEMLVD